MYRLAFFLFLFVGLVQWSAAQTVAINEFMASNDSTSMIVDEFDESDDWVELYNNSGQAIDLSNYYLSDDATELDKWQIPSGISIASNGYLIIWTDKDDEQGDLHTNFKLNKEGEQIILSTPQLDVVDSLSFGEQETNVSMARIPNGTGNFTPRAPTFGSNNDEPVAVSTPIREDFRVFPNPAQINLWIDFRNTEFSDENQSAEFQMLNPAGQVVKSKSLERFDASTVIRLNISDLPEGLYLVEIISGTDKFLQKVLVQ